MNIPHDKFCVLPWVSLEASPIGTVRPCCLADHEIIMDSGRKATLEQDSFEEIRNTRYMQQLREKFLLGDQPNACRRCWAEEDAGRTSKRMHTLDRLKHMIVDKTWTRDTKPLMFLDLKLGNICNLKCRICGSWSSSTFASEEIAAVPASERKQTYAYQMLQQGAWPRRETVFWKDLYDIADGIRYLEFTGGEPFMIQEHFDFLKSLVDRGLSENIEIHYNTNGTQWPEQGIAIWSRFKEVEIAVSVDDIGERFEYQRSNAKWSDVQINIQRFVELKQQHPNIRLQLCSTINIFNVLYFPQVAAWAETVPWDFVYWNMLHDAPQWCIANLSVDHKAKICESLEQSTIPERFRSDLDKIISFMFSRETENQNVHRYIAELDNRRGQDLRNNSPELAKILDYQGPNVSIVN